MKTSLATFFGLVLGAFAVSSPALAGVEVGNGRMMRAHVPSHDKAEQPTGGQPRKGRQAPARSETSAPTVVTVEAPVAAIKGGEQARIIVRMRVSAANRFDACGAQLVTPELKSGSVAFASCVLRQAGETMLEAELTHAFTLRSATRAYDVPTLVLKGPAGKIELRLPPTRLKVESESEGVKLDVTSVRLETADGGVSARRGEEFHLALQGGHWARVERMRLVLTARYADGFEARETVTIGRSDILERPESGYFQARIALVVPAVESAAVALRFEELVLLTDSLEETTLAISVPLELKP